MIVKVEVQGSFAVIRSKKNEINMTIAATTSILARMNGRTTAFFEAKVERGGGTKKWDGEDKITEYVNPTETVELDEAVPDQGW